MFVSDYTVELYNNFDAFHTAHPEEADELLEALGLNLDDVIHSAPHWVHDQLYYYPTLEDYAKYELTDGWHMAFDERGDFRSAPDPTVFIDSRSLTEALIDTVDPSRTVSVGSGVVVSADAF